MELPIIDAGGFESAGWHKSLDDACRRWGCFQIINHTLSGELMARTREEGRAFFALPREEKLAIERTRENAWGFFDQELTKNVRDWKEIFDFGPTATSGPMAGSVPQWPVGLPGFRSVMEAFYKAAEQVSQQILSAISCNLGMAPDHLAAGFASDQTSFLRLNFYPPCADPEAHLGISPHTDAGALTVLLTDDQPGLQFRQGDDWHTVRTVPGALVINIGDIVQVWSNDRYTAPLHRVLANAEQPRFSAPFFYNPSYELDYAPLPGVVTESSPARYRSINWGAFRAGRAAGDYADYGEEIQISQFRI
jgi:isopenicillin N synthase-like dioxygenase